MSQHLTLELSDEIYESLQQRSNAVGLSISEWILTLVSHPGDVANQPLQAIQQDEARQRFRRHAGRICLGYATSTDNESIDSDLADAYANEYEE